MMSVATNSTADSSMSNWS